MQTQVTEALKKNNRKSIFNYFQISAKTATSKKDRRSFLLGAVGVRSDGVMVKALNGPTFFPVPCAHAEARLAKKLDYYATVYVARVRLGDGEFAISKPCDNCMRALKAKKVKKIYYSISNDEYGIIDLKYS